MVPATRLLSALAAWLLLLCLAPAARGAAGTTLSPGSMTGDWRDVELVNLYGEPRRPSDFLPPKRPAAKGLVVAFLGVECPMAKLYGPRLQALAEEFADEGISFLGVDANSQDSLAELSAYGRRHGVRFDLCKDDRASAADAFSATRTPEVILLDASGAVRYRGRIDDQYGVGVAKGQAEAHYLRDALASLVAGREIALARTEPIGCVIGRPREPDPQSRVTFTEHVAPVLEKHCAECHREGEIAPFALRDYAEAAGWADTIAEVVRDQRMPPWHADPRHGQFANARILPEEEKQVLYDWAAAGAPEGDPAKLAPRREFVTGWRLPREPDLVVPMRDRPFQVPAEGIVDYQYFAYDPKFTRDTWVQAADVAPGDRSVVHHVIVFVSPPPEDPQRGLGWLAAYVPGQSSMAQLPGRARLVPAGSKLIFQMHYTPNGAEAEDLTRLGLVLADDAEVTEEVVSLVSANPKFEIPPGEPDHHVHSTLDWFPPDAKLLAIAPHMHFRGKSYRFTGVWPDGRRGVLLDVPRYDFNWQTNYELASPMALPAGFRVECDASFDNSAKNLANPDPGATVRWGDQSFEEMMVSFFEVAIPRGSLDKLRASRRELSDADRSEAERVAAEFFARYDGDGDGAILRRDLPHSMAIFAFARYDLDGDRRLTLDEVKATALADAASRF